MADSLIGGGQQQIVNGKTYRQYTPEWYAAMNEDKIRNANVAGTAAGTEEAAKIAAVSPALQGLLGAIGAGGVGGVSGGAGQAAAPGGVSGTSVPAGPSGVAPVDTSGAVRAEFANAKDQVGEETGGALTGLRAALAGRGLLGSGSESTGTRNVIMKGQGELGNVSRQNAITQADTAQKNATTSYEGAVTQRGQDIERATAQRGQDIQREQNMMQAQAQQAQLQLQQRAQSLQALQAALGSTMQAY